MSSPMVRAIRNLYRNVWMQRSMLCWYCMRRDDSKPLPEQGWIEESEYCLDRPDSSGSFFP